MMEKSSVLLVEDDVDFREALQIVFENNRFKVFTASDGEEALVNASKFRPDIILLDIMLPKKDGYAVCHELKADKRTSSIPILMLTSLGKKDEGKVGAELLARGHDVEVFMEKPVEPEMIIQKALELIAKSSVKTKQIPKTKILIIDDDPEFLAAIKITLEENGYETVTSYTGEDGLLAARKEDPDLILLDVMLPRKDGFVVCKEIKEDEKTRLIPVIMLTSVGEKLTEPGYAKAVAVTHKADDFIDKPVNSKELLKRIRMHIGPMRRLI